MIECDFYFILNFNQNNIPKIFGNAIVLTKIQDSNDYNVYFIKDSLWLKGSRIGNLKSIVVKNINLENVRIDK